MLNGAKRERRRVWKRPVAFSFLFLLREVPLEVWHALSGHRRRNGDPPRLCREGKRKLTESEKEFPKDSSRQSPEGSF
jgi:hypothetical protein